MTYWCTIHVYTTRVLLVYNWHYICTALALYLHHTCTTHVHHTCAHRPQTNILLMTTHYQEMSTDGLNCLNTSLYASSSGYLKGSTAGNDYTGRSGTLVQVQCTWRSAVSHPRRAFQQLLTNTCSTLLILYRYKANYSCVGIFFA